MRYSLPLNIVRYANGTLVKLTASATDFISYDYDPDQDTGTYTPSSIVITAKLAGNLTYSRWQYRKDGGSWIDIPASNDLSITVTSSSLTIYPASSLFDKVNSYVLFRCVATDNDSGEEYTDTVEIGRIVDYIILYRKQQTLIDQDASKIALIASDEQLRQYGRTNTVVSDLSALKVTASEISTTVSRKVGKDEIISKINQSAEQIKISASKVNIEGAAIFSSGRLSQSSLNSAYDSNGAATSAVNSLKTDLASGSGTTVINGRHISTGVIDADLITAGTIKDASNKNSWNLNTGQFTTKQGVIASMTINDSGLLYNSTIANVASNQFRIYRGILQARSLMNAYSTGLDVSGNAGIKFYYNSNWPSDPWDGMTEEGFIGPQIGGFLLSARKGASIHLLDIIHLYAETRVFDDLFVTGTITATGRKHRMVETEHYDDRLLYCYETPTPLFGDIGEAVLDEEGLCYVDIDDIFGETIAEHVEYQVFLQKEGPGDCWIAVKQRKYFVIEGTPNLRVAWELKAKQKDYEMERLERYDNGLDEYERLNEQDSLLDDYIKEQEDILYGNY